MKKLYIFLLTFCMFATASWAYIQPRGLMKHVQPDGTTLSLTIKGNDAFFYYATIDGYAVGKDANNTFRYISNFTENGYKLTTLTAHNPSDRSESELNRLLSVPKAKALLPSAPSTRSLIAQNTTINRIGSKTSASLKASGSPVIPVVLAQFTDRIFTVAETEAEVNKLYHNFFNGDGSGQYYTQTGSYGSVQDYFVAQSDSIFTPQFVVIGPVTLSNSYAYYGQNGTVGKDLNINSFYKETMQLAQNEMTDWDQFDNDGNGIIDMAFIIYAGEGENGAPDDPDAIWPKELTSTTTINNVKYGAFGCCNELFKGKMDGIGTTCHEISHALGLPDMYGVGTSADVFGMDFWDIMDSGNYCNTSYHPCGYTAYEKDFLGWGHLKELNLNKPQKLTLRPISEGGDGYKMMSETNPNEYYILENRQNTGWDKYVGYSRSSDLHHGMLLEHVDYSYSVWTANHINTDANHQRFTLIPAGGELMSFTAVNSSDSRDLYWKITGSIPFPGSKEVTALKGEDQPLYSEQATMNHPLADIEEDENGIITLKIDVTDALQCPVPQMHTDDALHNVTWNEVENAQNYRYQIAEDEAFTQPLLNVDTATTQLCLLEKVIPFMGEEENKTFYFRVQARADLSINSPYSSAMPFVVTQQEVGINPVTISATGTKNVPTLYNLQGIKVAENFKTIDELQLPRGIYIMVQGNENRKVMVP